MRDATSGSWCETRAREPGWGDQAGLDGAAARLAHRTCDAAWRFGLETQWGRIMHNAPAVSSYWTLNVKTVSSRMRASKAV